MKRFLLALLASAISLGAAQRLLIVADEIPAMETLSRELGARTKAESKIVTQSELPASLEAFDALLVYIHKDIHDATEKAILEYLRGGRKVILLHHSISSGKRKNKEWLPAFAITLPLGKLEEGGYGYYDPTTFELVNLAPGHPVTTAGVRYDGKTLFAANGAGPSREMPSFTVPGSEVYLNHIHNAPRTKLLGFKWTDPRNGKVYQQETAGWVMKVGKGTAFFFMAGHEEADFNIEPFAQILANAVTYKD
ncbi:MAG: ThuA domain-containing protein [Bryobacteraceae bacterium]|nr:ThuA domain-containing protein [Bryobacteraceae bacterium]